MKGHWKILCRCRIRYFRCSKGDFYAQIVLAMSNVSDTLQKNRRGVGASCSVLLCYLHPSELISDRYPNKDKRDTLSRLIITQREVIRVTRREQLCIFMKYKDVGIGPNNWIFQGFPDIIWYRVLFDSFDPLNFVHWYLYCTYDNILCLHPFCSITSRASGRNISPVILPTIIFVFLSILSCKASPCALDLFKFL